MALFAAAAHSDLYATFHAILYPGSDPDAAARSAYLEWDKIFSAFPSSGLYTAKLSMIETENGYAILVKATVDKAARRNDDDDDEPEEPEDPGYTVDDDSSYTVTSADGLLAWNEAVQKDMTLNCTLADNIDLKGIDWTPIGTSFSNSYTGTFDGGGHTITGLTVKGSDEYAGLFGYIGSGGTVKNVKLENVQITSDYQYAYVGGVAGNNDGAIENCSVSGSVSGNSTYNRVGGVVGYQMGGSITGCSSSATVKGTGSVGGVVGQTNYGATLTACYSTENVTLESNNSDNNYAGGVVGVNGASSTLTACYHATGTVSGPVEATGGVAGRNFKDSMSGGGIISACYWGGNGQEQGIGEDQVGTGETTKVDGTDVTWSSAMTSMNEALQSAGSAWRYELTDTLLPTLKKTINPTFPPASPRGGGIFCSPLSDPTLHHPASKHSDPCSF